MRSSVIISFLLHAAVFVAAYVGLPGLKPPPVLTETPVIVELVEVSDITRAPPPKREPAKKAEPKPEPPKPPEPPQRAEPAPPPPAPPAPEPEPEIAAVPAPQPKPKAKKKPEPKPEPKPVPEAKPKPSQVLAKVKPKRKPTAPDAFASVLKTVKALKSVPEEKPKKATAKPKDDFQAAIQQALQSNTATSDVVEKLTISEIDLVKHQIMQCWNVQGGYKGIEDLAVEIFVAMNPDGTRWLLLFDTHHGFYLVK